MGVLDRWYRWIESVNPSIKDGLLALVLTGTLIMDLFQQDLPPGTPFRDADALGYGLVALLVLPLALRSRFPVGVFLVVLGAATATAGLFYRPTSFGFGLIVATYSVGRLCDRRLSLVALAIAELFVVFIKVRAAAAGLDIAWFEWPLDATYFGAAWFLGASSRTRRRYADELEQNREALAEKAVAVERTRIARELHDAIGHSVSVMVLHAGGGDELLDDDPQRARRAFKSIADVGRGALTEMDRLIGLLRADDEPNPSLQADLENLGTLIDGYRELGLDIHLQAEPMPSDLPAALELSIFRIIEEALTNSIKHAGPTKVEVTVAYDSGQVHITVRDHGGRLRDRPLGRRPHAGRGLVGIQERTALFDGETTAAPHPEGGFVVAASLAIGERQKT